MKRMACATAAFLSALVLRGHAQPIQPIYLQYDGYVRNKDNHTLTLSFGYYNMNHVEVRLPVGDANGFTPGPSDRNQPVTFLEGRHRFACAMVVPENFDGKLQWQVKFGGTIATTTDKVLNPLYELEPNSERRVMAGLELRNAPRGACVNRSPLVQVLAPGGAAALGSTPSFSARLGSALVLNGEVQDDGLPRESRPTVSWKKIRGPGAVNFSSTDLAITRATFTAPGEYELELTGSDGEKTGSVRVKVVVAAAAMTSGGN